MNNITNKNQILSAKDFVNNPIIFDFLMKPATTRNALSHNAWGVAVDGDTLYCVSGFSFIKIENIGSVAGLESYKELPKGAFYSYMKEGFVEYGYPMTIKEIEDTLASLSFRGNTEFPTINMANIISTLSQEEVERSRTVITPSVTRENSAGMIFEKTEEGYIYRVPGVDKPFRASEESYMPLELIKPGNTYTCHVMGQDNSYYHVDVIEPYGKVRLGINCSDSPISYERVQELNGLIGIPANRMLCSNVLETSLTQAEAPLGMHPTHIDTGLLVEALTPVIFSNSESFEVHFGENELHPVMIQNSPDAQLRVTAIVASLSTESKWSKR
ncbi:MAG: hypothetical protein RR420_01400 [Anaerovoracaceae bacterium]